MLLPETNVTLYFNHTQIKKKNRKRKADRGALGKVGRPNIKVGLQTDLQKVYLETFERNLSK